MIANSIKLTEGDWQVLQHLSEILEHYGTVVKTLEGDGQIPKRKGGETRSYGNVWDVILGFEKLLGVLERAKQDVEYYPNPEHFRVGINLAWDKLDEYYQSKS